MGRLTAWQAAFAVALLLSTAAVALDAQTPAAGLVASARAKLSERQYADAAALLRLALEPQANAATAERSEERRVGKECRL